MVDSLGDLALIGVTNVRKLFALGILLMLSASASAGIVNVVGLTQITAPTVTVQSNFLSSNGLPSQVIWAEQQGVLLLSPLVTDTGVIDAGTVVDSYFLALNTDAAFNVAAKVSATFDGLVLGLVYLEDANYSASPNYKGTDFLGAFNTVYAERFCSACAFETFQIQGPPDLGFDTASFTGSTASFLSNYSVPGDFARILTTHPVPAPIAGAGFAGIVTIITLLLARRWKL